MKKAIVIVSILVALLFGLLIGDIVGSATTDWNKIREEMEED